MRRIAASTHQEFKTVVNELLRRGLAAGPKPMSMAEPFVVKPHYTHPLTAPKPDVMARLQEVWGDRVFTMEEVNAMREAELELPA